ncbi:hypothetical protein GGX14DRAFT_402315 [Mycena pura]|uniref:Uncharacterized protein n=1 Tax=Mycena pura TaxID=153505 RepID=A0AAD6V2H1_9AGAR|nr:hypothetical protein GGX14DRAFT_402315 [Mycena pura]
MSRSSQVELRVASALTVKSSKKKTLRPTPTPAYIDKSDPIVPVASRSKRTLSQLDADDTEDDSEDGSQPVRIKVEPVAKKARRGSPDEEEENVDDEERSVPELDPTRYLVHTRLSAAGDMAERRGARAPNPAKASHALQEAFTTLLKTGVKQGEARVNVDLAKDEQVFLQLVKKTNGHAYTFHSGLGNTTRRHFTDEEKAHKTIVGPIDLIDANKVSELSFANATIPLSPCITCVLCRRDCQPLGLGAPCATCVVKKDKKCSHAASVADLVAFYLDLAREHAVASDLTEVLIDQLLNRLDAASESSRLHRRTMEELSALVEHFANHVRDCVKHLGPDGFQARFKNSHPDNPVVELVDMFIQEHNYRVAGVAVDAIGSPIGPDIIPTSALSPSKSVYFTKGGPASVRASKVQGLGVEGGSKSTGEDIGMSTTSGPGS